MKITPQHRSAASTPTGRPRPAGRTRRLATALTVGAVIGILVGSLLRVSTAQAATGDGSPTDPNITFVGRWNTTNAAAYVPGFAGAYLRTGFTGTTVKLRQRNAIDLYYSIDGGADVYIQNVSGTVNLTPTKLAAGNHTLRVSYRVVAGSYAGDAVFQGLVLDSGATTRALPRPANLIEFIGDSITVGTTSSENALTAYGWLTGEKLGADHTQIAVGGSCLVSAADGCLGMADRFLRVQYNASDALWDFSRYQASAVVINMGTNDKTHLVTSEDFQSTYTQLLRTVRAKYPKAAIFALRTFIGRYATETQAAVATVTGEGQASTYYVDTTGWIPDGGLTDSVHPNDSGHVAITAKLAPIIAAKLNGGGTSTPTPTATASATVSPTPSATPTFSPTAGPTVTPTATASPTPSSSPTSPPTGACAVTYKVTNSWSGGLQVDVTVKNTGTAAVNGWSLAWAMPTGQAISQAWNAVATQSGSAATATNAGWNAAIAAGGSAGFGFLATGSNPTVLPTSFALNGAACSIA